MRRTNRRHLDAAAFTHPGLSRRNNEDRYAVASFAGPARTPVLFAVVCDGIGGHRAGEVAAELAVDLIIQTIAHSNGKDPPGTMRAAIRGASREIAERSAANPEQAGMGSTCACIWLAGDRLYTAHVGDSRIYLARDGEICRLTVDHTWVQEAIEAGVLAPSQARENPNAHVLRRYLGSSRPPTVDFGQPTDTRSNGGGAGGSQGRLLMPGDTVMACSDGLTDCLGDDEILSLITSGQSLESAAEDLVARANENGGQDNTTVILIRAADAPSTQFPRGGDSRKTTPAL